MRWGSPGSDVFQFHKVRLKVVSDLQGWRAVRFQFHKVRLKVSKSRTSRGFEKQFQFHKVRLKATDFVRLSVCKMFQFHKVRLKDPGLANTIPTKSFQFHKVRLKVSGMRWGSPGSDMFQFHKVRLKGDDTALFVGYRLVSIP